MLKADLIEVANMSLAGRGSIGRCEPRSSQPNAGPGRANHDLIHQLICTAYERGVTLVAAAGNEAAKTDRFTPAAYDEVLAVSAFADFDGQPGGLAETPDACLDTERDDHFTTSSSFGSPIDISVPGVCGLDASRRAVHHRGWDEFLGAVRGWCRSTHRRPRPQRLAAADPSADPRRRRARSDRW